MTSVAMIKAQRKPPPQRRCYGIFQLFQGLSICLQMEMTQKTLHGMQKRETAMKCSAILLIPPSGRRLIICILISGMNPYSSLSTQHSSWHVFLVIYNLPPWLCMRKYMMLSMMICDLGQEASDNILKATQRC